MVALRKYSMALRLRYSALSLAAVLVGGMVAMSAQSNRPDAKAHRPAHGAVLVELFTSEGCSSCPPADALLRKINGKYTDSGQLIVGVSEHVTYWNYLGWSVPFSSEAYTERQSAYGLRFHLDSVCTPQTGDQRRGTDRRPRQLRSPSCNPKGAATASREDTYCFSQP
jgi:hypothetical protein